MNNPVTAFSNSCGGSVLTWETSRLDVLSRAGNRARGQRRRVDHRGQTMVRRPQWSTCVQLAEFRDVASLGRHKRRPAG